MEMDHKSKLIMTYGFLKGLAASVEDASPVVEKINDFCERMNFEDLLGPAKPAPRKRNRKPKAVQAVPDSAFAAV
jgi:hypothetical protein